MRTIYLKAGAMLLGAALVAAPARASAAAESPRLAYARVLGQERVLREADARATLAQIRSVMASYERMQVLIRRVASRRMASPAMWP